MGTAGSLEILVSPTYASDFTTSKKSYVTSQVLALGGNMLGTPKYLYLRIRA